MSAFTRLLSVLGEAVRGAAPAAAVVYLGRAAALPEAIVAINLELRDSRRHHSFLGDIVTWITDLDIEIAAQGSPRIDESADHAADAVLERLWPALQWAQVRAALAPLGVTGYCDAQGAPVDVAQALRRTTTSGTAPTGRISLQISVMHHTVANSLTPYSDPPA